MLSQKKAVLLNDTARPGVTYSGSGFSILFGRIYGIVPQVLLAYLHLTAESLQFLMLNHHVLSISLKFVCGYWLIWYELR